MLYRGLPSSSALDSLSASLSFHHRLLFLTSSRLHKSRLLVLFIFDSFYHLLAAFYYYYYYYCDRKSNNNAIFRIVGNGNHARRFSWSKQLITIIAWVIVAVVGAIYRKVKLQSLNSSRYQIRSFARKGFVYLLVDLITILI